MTGDREPQPHPGAALSGPKIGGVLEFDAAAMVLQHAADNGEPETGALLARRYIRFQQPRTADLRQADSVIDHVDHDVVVFARRSDVDASLAQLFRRHLFD